VPSPARPRPAFLDAPGPLALAHRGFSREGPENTMAAFAAAVRLGYRYLETDVRATADGVCVVFHDRALERMTDARGEVSRMPWRSLARARVAGCEPVPRLEDVLEAWPQVRLNVDVKAASAAGPFARAVLRCGAQDRVLVASFSDRRRRAALRALAAAGAPGVATSAGVTLTTAVVAASAVRAPGALVRRLLRDVDAVQVPPAAGGVPVVTPALLRAVHDAGRHVHAWTVDDAASMHGLLDAGVDGIVSDRPDTLRDVLRSRGQWWEGTA
jgi:glycerophosphoryl diester phosphodiesterase